MRGRRAKQYKKLMHQYGLSFGFREPYQVLIDANMVKDADRFKMDLVAGLERTLHGKVKPSWLRPSSVKLELTSPVITQCSMRHLYASSSEPGMPFIIDKAKLFERRRCDHRPEEYPDALSSVECLSSVVDPKGTKHNKHRYVVASQDPEVRKLMRTVMGVPLVYISRSVMIMEPMAVVSMANRDREEKGKFRDGLKRTGTQGAKRKRDDADEYEHGLGSVEDTNYFEAKKKKIYGRGPKGPNPLSVKKPKRFVKGKAGATPLKESNPKLVSDIQRDDVPQEDIQRKRRRKHKSGERGSMAAGDEGTLQGLE